MCFKDCLNVEYVLVDRYKDVSYESLDVVYAKYVFQHITYSEAKAYVDFLCLK